MTLFRKVIRTMLEHKARYIGSMLLLIIISMMFVMMNMTSINLDSTFKSFSEQNILSDAEFSTIPKSTRRPLVSSLQLQRSPAARPTAK